MLNKIILIGRLTDDPELRYTPNGVAVTNFSLAVERPYTNQQGDRDVDFIDIVVWRKQAENCANHLGKGRLVAVEGRLQIRSYETNEGQRRKVSEVVANNVQFLDWPSDSRPQGQGQRQGKQGDNFDEEDIDVPF
ncbi:MAG: single-stranded DNA-binding protein [Bacillota bacterium]